MQFNTNTILFIQSKHPEFQNILKDILQIQPLDTIITYAQSSSFHQINKHQILISSGQLIAKFAQNTNFDIKFLNDNLKFAVEYENTHLQINLVYLGIDQWVKQKLGEIGDCLIGYIAYFECITNQELQQSYSNQLCKYTQDLYLISSPFGLMSSEMYKNTLKKCIISLALTKDSKQILFLDMIYQVGHEGGSLYNKNGEYIGMLTPTIKQINQESKYYSYAINWNCIYEILTKQKLVIKQLNNNDQILQNMINCSYLLISDSKFGCCTLISDYKKQKSYIITAKHVLSEVTKNHKFFIVKQNIEQEVNLIEHCNSDIDFAIGSTQEFIKDGININQIIYNSSVLQIGQTIYVVGFHQTQFERHPIIKKGHILKLVYDYDSKLSFLLTDCFVHNGNSGGGVFDENGYLIGIVSFNIIDQKNGKICDMVFNVSLSLLKPIFQELVEIGIIEKSKGIFNYKSKFLQDSQQLQTRFAIPEIGYYPKL